MKPHRTASIRTRLAWLVAACVAPPVVAAALFIAYSFQQQQTELVHESISGARALMSAIDREFESADTLLAALATSPSLASNDIATFHAQVQEVQQLGVISNISLVDSTGQELMNSDVPYGGVLPMTQRMAQVERVLKSGASDVSDLGKGHTRQEAVTHIAVPVPNTRPRQVLLGTISPARLQKVLLDYGLPQDRITAVFDKSATIVARTHEPARFLGRTVAPALQAALDKAPEGTLNAITLEGTPVISSYTRSANSGWGVVIGVQSNVLTASLQRSMAILAAFAAAFFALSLSLAWVMGGRIARAVSALGPPAAALGSGLPVEVPALPIREADAVGKALVKASLALSGANDAVIGSEARMRGIVESAMDAIVTVNDEQRILVFNPAAGAMFNCLPEDAIGKPITLFIPERFHAQHFAFIDRYRAIASDGAEPGAPAVAVGLRQNGEEFPIELSYSNALDSGAAFHTLIVRDVTSRVRAYEALERSNLDLQQFAYVASHDLKTPLRSIGGFVQLLERNYADRLDEKALSLIHRTAQAANRLEQLTDDLLSYARLSAEAKPFELVDCNEVGREIIHLLDAVIRQSGAEITMDPLPQVMGDRTQLVQLFLNLTSNGIKYCRGRAPRVRVSALDRGQAWEFSFADNGIGIDAKYHDRIFEVFKRLHTQKEYPGTGIGLAVCRRVVERHGGNIWVTSTVDEGSTFHFTLPHMPAQGSSS